MDAKQFRIVAIFVAAVLLGLLVIIFALFSWILNNPCNKSRGFELAVRNGDTILEKLLIEDEQIAAKIRQGTRSPLTFEGTSFEFIVSTNSGMTGSQLRLSEDEILIIADSFIMRNEKGELLFMVNKDELILAKQSLYVTTEQSSTFCGSLQTSLITSFPSNDLSIESRNGELFAYGANGVIISSGNGEIRATSYKDLTITSLSGFVHINAPRIYLGNLPTAPDGKGQQHNRIAYFLCACHDSKVFQSVAHCFKSHHFCK